MIQNYLKLSLRHLASHRYFTLINILGLGCGIAAMVWAFQTYRFSFSFDDFQPDRDQIFRLVSYKEASPERKGIVPFPMIEAARQEMAGIAESMRYEDIRLTVKADQGESFQELIQFVDPTFFSFFNFPLLEGSPDISDPSGIVITEKMAEKYFGKRENYREILGKTLNLYAGEAHQMPMTIKGVLKNPPMNSAFQLMNAVTNFQNIRLPDGHPLQADAWDWFLGAAFFRLKQPAESATIAKALEKYIPLQNKARQDWKITGFELISMRDHARMDDIDANYLMGRPEDSAAYGPLVMAFLLLLSACLNFANTMVSRSNRRLKEMGIRKVLGGSRSQLIRQMLLECAAVVILAIGLSMLINRWWIPAFNRMFVFTDAQTDYLHDPILLLFLGCTLFFTTLLAGGYPAFYLSRFNPNSIFRGSVKFGGNNSPASCWAFK